MRRASLGILLTLSLGSACLAATPPSTHPQAAGTLFVAPDGNDAWSGTKPATDATGNGPFATIEKALAAARKSTAPHSEPQGTIIMLRGGTYFLSKPVVLTTNDSNITFAAFENEQPSISGGRRIKGWKQVAVGGKSLWAADLPEVREGKWMFRELWVSNQSAVRARHPNHGYLKVAGLPDSTSEWTKGQQRFRFTPGDLPAWQTITNAEVIVMNRWVESRLPVSSLDLATNIVSFKKRSVFQLAAGDLYYLEGALEALDEPGEWYLDPTAGTLYYFPRPGETPANAEVIAPVLTQLCRLEGHPESGNFIRQLTFRGITFSHAEWSLPPVDSSKGSADYWMPKAELGGFGQAAVGVPGAVWGEGLRECEFDHCRFVHLGTYGLELGRGCQSNRVAHCELADLGAGGIKLGEPAIRNSEREQTAGNDISHCTIHDGGKVFHSAIGIWLGQTPNNRLTHNLIHDFFYTGISIGWTWGYGAALASNNLVAFNHVHHIGIKSDGDGPILSDMGGIYTLGRQPGTCIINNLWHDIAGLQYGGWGIYFDEGSSGILATSNVVYRTTHGGFHQHYGETNRVENNIFAFARDHQLQRSRPEPHNSFILETNIVYFDSGVLLGGDWSNDHYQLDRNLYFDSRPGKKPEDLSFADASLDKWHARGHDTNSVIGDPFFVDPKKADFQLRPDSPARKLGFRPIDLSRVGPR